MSSGKQYKFGDIILCRMQFVDTHEVKTRPAVVLFEEFNNIIVAAITSNQHMKGIPIGKEEGMKKNSVVKLNYIFTISNFFIKKKLFRLTQFKKDRIREELCQKLV